MQLNDKHGKASLLRSMSESVIEFTMRSINLPMAKSSMLASNLSQYGIHVPDGFATTAEGSAVGSQIASGIARVIGLCGQAPSDYPEFAKFLIECGIDSISYNADALLAGMQNMVRAEKSQK
jgi:hypothetical protein